MQDTNLTTTVAEYRQRALRVLSLWTYHWMMTVEGRSSYTLHDANAAVSAIQTQAWARSHRNPTLLEWTYGLLHGEFQDFVHLRAGDLHILKPWAQDFNRAQRNVPAALADWSMRVCRAFAYMSGRELPDTTAVTSDDIQAYLLAHVVRHTWWQRILDWLTT